MKEVLKTTNKVLIYLTLSDVFTWGPYIIISALAGLYLATKLDSDVVEVIGVGISIYYLTRAVLQIPVGALTDRLKKDRDEIIILFIGVVLMGLPFLFYPLITQAYQYYILQFLFGLGASLNVTNWRKLFALNMMRGREGVDYAKYDTVISFATAFLSLLIGYIANLGEGYFDLVMILSGITIMTASVWVGLIYKTKKRKSNNI